ncbi:MAG: UbiA family prenyltransferase [Thermoanaerobaculia bacterium]
MVAPPPTANDPGGGPAVAAGVAPVVAVPAGRDTRPPGSWIDYLAMARLDHWIKHVFIVPGIVLAVLLLRPGRWPSAWVLLLGFASAALVASANYVLNEWLDAGFDAHHPRKASRPAVRKRLSPLVVYLEYGLLLAAGVALALTVGKLFTVFAVAFGLSGLAYNVPPLRFKKVPVLDVLSESINNPIRLILGWAMVDGTTLPPSTLLLTYWMGGAFLMATKRFAEYRSVSARVGVDALVRYRRSFGAYSEGSLLVSAFLYALMAAFFLAIFLVKYRIEYLLAFPLFAALFGAYLHIGLRPESAAESPERLFRERSLFVLLALLVFGLILLTWLDLPALGPLTDPHYIVLPWGRS